MQHKKMLVVTAGEASTALKVALPQLVTVFAGMQQASVRIIDADIGDGLVSNVFECDRLRPGAAADLGAKIVDAYRETDLLLIDVGPQVDNVAKLQLLLESAKEEAAVQGRFAVAYLPGAFGGSPAVIRFPEEKGILADLGFKVRLALFADRARRIGHVQCLISQSLIPYGSLPPLGRGLAELVQRDGPTLTRYLATTTAGYGFAANHIRGWLNRCIDGRVFDDIIGNDRLVPGTDQLWFTDYMRRAAAYKFEEIANLDEAHDDELFKRYPKRYSDARHIMAGAHEPPGDFSPEFPAESPS